MPSKKKKYNSRFPPARIKKIMQTDEDIGKVAAAVPVLISKCLEMFLSSLLTKAGDVTKSKRAKTMSCIHLKDCIMSETMFDFLKDQVAHIQDLQGEEEGPVTSGVSGDVENPNKVSLKRSLPKPKKASKKRVKLDNGSDHESGDDSDNASGNERTEGNSSGLLSPSIQRKLESQRSYSKAHVEDEPSTSEKKPTIHIPLDMLMSNNEILSSAKAETSVSRIERDWKTATGNKMKVEQPTTKMLPSFGVPQSRQGVIVTNSSAYSQPVPLVVSSPAKSKLDIFGTSLQQDSVTNKPIIAKVSENVKAENECKALQRDLPSMNTQHESMLSLLHSPMPMSVTATSNVATVQNNLSNEKYAYSPLSQQPRQSMLYPGVTITSNGVQASDFSKQVPPYIPPATQRHFLGYPQTMLTPHNQNPLMAVHPGMAQMKPTPRTRSDDDDDYDT